MSVTRPAILRLAVFFITLAVFARLTACAFSWWDDQDTIRQNRWLNPPTWSSLEFYWDWRNAGEQKTMGLYVPVTYTAWAGLAKMGHLSAPDAEGFTLNPVVFHSANVVIHAITAVVCFQLLLGLFGNALPAFCGALLFAVHPVQVETVGWISGTKDLLCGLLSTSALLMYVRSVQCVKGPGGPGGSGHRWPARWRYLLGMLLFVLAMLAKPTGVVTPLMAAVISIFLLHRSPGKTAISLLPWFVLMIPCLYWTREFQPAEWADPLPVWARGGVALDALAFYFAKLIWPAHLCIDYGHNPPAILADQSIYFTWIVPVAVASFLWWRWPKGRTAVAAGLLFVIPLLPVLGFVPFEFQLISTTADHYLYLPMVGVGMLITWAMTAANRGGWLMAGVLTALAIRSMVQEPVWQDSRALFQHTLAVNPRSTQSLDSLGFLTGRDARRLADAGKTTEARALFDKSIYWYQKALQAGPTSIPTMYNLALDYQRIDRADLALQQIQHMVKLQPDIAPGLRTDPIHLAKLLVEFGDARGAIAWLDQVIAHNPNDLLAMQARAHLQEILDQPASVSPRMKDH